MARVDLEDPSLGDWYIDKLIGAVMSDAPIGPGVCYLATNLRRHLDERAMALDCQEPRLEPALNQVRARLDDAAQLAEGLEAALGQLIAVTGMYKRLAARELTRTLEMLREHLFQARQLELEISLQTHWVDIGGRG